MPVSGVLKQLLEYWQRLPREYGAGMPARACLNAGTLHEILPKLTLMKRLDKYDILVSTMGTKNTTHLQGSTLENGPLLGFNAFDLTAPYMRENAARFYETVMDQPSGAIIREATLRKDGKKANVASLYLPLADKYGEPNYMMGCSVHENKQRYDKVHNLLVLGHQPVHDIEFINIGYGKPVWKFTRPQPHTNIPVETRWWDKLLPTSISRTDHNRLNS